MIPFGLIEVDKRILTRLETLNVRVKLYYLAESYVFVDLRFVVFVQSCIEELIRC